MHRTFVPFLFVAAAMFVFAPIYIAQAPFEPTMGLVQKIFYFHFPAAILMLMSAIIGGIASAWFLVKKRSSADRLAFAAAELAVLFGVMTLVTGPLWARKAWGVWWQWDARLTMSLLLWMIFVAYLLLRRYGGPGSETLAAGLAVFGMANVPFIYVSVNVWRTIHPKTTVVPTLPVSMGGPLWFSFGAFVLLYVALLTARMRLEEQRSRLEQLYLDLEE
jgi:heme exporter protein C